MLSNEVQLLETATEALNNWRTQAESVGVTLDTITLIFPSNDSVQFIWDAEIAAWRISTLQRFSS